MMRGGTSIVDLSGMATTTADMFSLTVQATEHPHRVDRDSAGPPAIAIPNRQTRDNAKADANTSREGKNRPHGFQPGGRYFCRVLEALESGLEWRRRDRCRFVQKAVGIY